MEWLLMNRHPGTPGRRLNSLRRGGVLLLAVLWFGATPLGAATSRGRLSMENSRVSPSARYQNHCWLSQFQPSTTQMSLPSWESVQNRAHELPF
jgi:hypothetical protein